MRGKVKCGRAGLAARPRQNPEDRLNRDFLSQSVKPCRPATPDPCVSEIVDLRALEARLPRGARLLGIDLGTKTVGLALSDPGRMIASPMQTLKRGKFSRDAEEIARIITEQGVGGFVIGLPVNMDGSEGPRCQSARAFARNLARHFGLPVALWDERLSTAAVTRTLIAADASRTRRAELVDKMAAAYILQGALDRLRESGTLG
ncbi:MAG TPA: Holliday junction resolvase RuvX [Alphaproteobacteria bacterium]|nr:Holliday junction resolvase RuvX [Alphaproteobacteria bacterium]